MNTSCRLLRLVTTLNLIKFYLRIGLGMVKNFIVRRACLSITEGGMRNISQSTW